MANVISWDPFQELSDMQNTMERYLDRGYARPWRLINGQIAAGYFPIDMYETRDEIVVEASLPGAKPDDVKISVTGDTLSLSAESHRTVGDQEPTYYRQERQVGAVQRAIGLPVRVDADSAQANFENGVLTLHLPKVAEARPKSIPVKAGS